MSHWRGYQGMAQGNLSPTPVSIPHHPGLLKELSDKLRHDLTLQNSLRKPFHRWILVVKGPLGAFHDVRCVMFLEKAVINLPEHDKESRRAVASFPESSPLKKSVEKGDHRIRLRKFHREEGCDEHPFPYIRSTRALTEHRIRHNNSELGMLIKNCAKLRHDLARKTIFSAKDRSARGSERAHKNDPYELLHTPGEFGVKPHLILKAGGTMLNILRSHVGLPGLVGNAFPTACGARIEQREAELPPRIPFGRSFPPGAAGAHHAGGS